jgi:hypothetical protein
VKADAKRGNNSNRDVIRSMVVDLDLDSQFCAVKCRG